MAKIILIETSTALCSVALSVDGQVVAYRESSAPKAHASLTAVFVQEVLADAGLTLKDCDAVCVGEGPGSYTGLRVGVSTAKGLCFGAGLPLIAIGTMEVLAAQALIDHHLTADAAISATDDADAELIVPMIDARRMEVYTATFTADGERLTSTEPKIIDAESFADELQRARVLFIGDGAGKCEGTIVHANARFVQCQPKASSMAGLAEEAYKEKRFKDVAYFEPFYLKEFVATVSKKKLF